MKYTLILAILFITASSYAKNILHIGDSHSAGIFGQELSRLLKNNSDFTSASYGSCGAIAQHYFSGKATTCGYFQNDHLGNIQTATTFATPKVEDILKDFNPELAIIQLGGNYAGYTNDYIKNNTLKMAQIFVDRGIKCLWVGTPDARNNAQRRNEVKELIKNNIGHLCEFFDSTLHTTYPTTGSDGIHYWGSEGSKVAKDWAKKVYEITLGL